MDKFINVFTLIEKLKIRVFDFTNDERIINEFDIIRNEVSKIKTSARTWMQRALEYEIYIEDLEREAITYQEEIEKLDKQLEKDKVWLSKRK